MSSIEREFSDTLQLLTDFNPGKVLVAFSGGCDSTALLALTCKSLGPSQVEAVYVNHRIRPDSELDIEIEQNKKTCERLGVRLTLCDLGYGAVEKAAALRKGGTEDAARYLRYTVLNQKAQDLGCSYILTAHHMDDQVETVLMRIISGSPVTSLRGIKEKSGNIIRPLLAFSKNQLQDYITELGLTFSTDSTNLETTYKRNEIRNEILPELKLIMPDCCKRILAIRDKAVDLCGDFEFEGSHSVELNWFKSLSTVQKTIVLYSCWDKVVGNQLPQTLINRVLCTKTDSVVSANGGAFTFYNGRIYITSNNNVRFEFEPKPLSSEGVSLPTGVTVCLSKTGSKTDLRFPKEDCSSLMVRFAKVTDKIKLKDGTKTVFRLLQDQKIPSVLRNRVPVVVKDEEVVGVIGESAGGRNRICQRFLTSLAPNDGYYYINIKIQFSK